ncbi:MAG TPA: endonuclease/exonuclease/phosphatase family protein [Rubricoccaceae bacterium]|jgi:endonuclease/exonuclease/phosphatase family metal-dependent hydrolase
MTVLSVRRAPLRAALLLVLVTAAGVAVPGCSGPARTAVPGPVPAGTAPAAASQTATAFVVGDPPVWTVPGMRIASFNGEFLFDGEGDEGQADFPWKGDPEASRAHRDAVGRVVRMLDADIVMMPETENLHALTLLNTESLADMGYTPYLVPGQDAFTGQNLGLLARVPVDTTGRTDERVAVGVSDRLYGVSKNLFARLTLGGVPVTIIGVHFLAQPDNPERQPQREAQGEVIRRLVAAEAAAGRQLVVMGDFNDFDDRVLDRRGSVPITNVLATIKRAGDGPADDLVNVISDIPQAERYTSLYDRNSDDVIGPDDLSAIDHILLSPALYARVRDVRYVHAHDPRTVTDHFPIVVTLGE